MKIKRTSELLVGIGIAFLAWILCGAVTPARASCRIQDISLEKAGKFTKVTVYADGPFEFAHATEEAKDGKPYRVIIDCKDALFGLPQNNFTQGLPAGTIRSIRTSQFEVAPERIVRVVLDVEGPVVYKVLDNKDENRISLAVLTAQDPDFPMWTAIKAEGDAEPEIKTGEKQVTAAKSKTEAKPREKTGTHPKAVSYVDADERIVTAKDPVGFSSGRSTASATGTVKTPETVGSTPGKPALSKTSETETSTKMTTAALKRQASQPTAVRKKISRSPVPLGPFPEEATVVQKTGRDRAKTTEESKQLVSTPAAPGKTEDTMTPSVSSSESKQSLVQRAPRRRRISLSSAPLGPHPEEPSVAQAAAQTPADQTKDIAQEAAGVIAGGLGKILGPESVVAKETRMPPESLMLAQESGQIQLGEVPLRKVVHYDPGVKRDPFVPLTDKQDMSFGAAPLPLFESLKLVGILRDNQGNQALLEDQMGFGYILAAGDRIKDGYVMSVEDNQATFQVEDYGGYQIMVLQLNQEY